MERTCSGAVLEMRFDRTYGIVCVQASGAVANERLFGPFFVVTPTVALGYEL